MPPPKIIEESLDYWVTESTYGGIIHPDRLLEIEKIKSLVRECSERRGKLFIPSFALERAQEIIYLLSYAMFKKEIPRIPIFLDSPMATDILDVFSGYWKTQLFKDQYKLNFNPFNAHSNKFLKISRTFEQSEGLISGRGPYVIIAGSGMGDAGRIRSHYKKGLASNKNTVAMIGYTVSGTLNRAIIDGQKRIKIDGKYYSVKAKIEKFGSFSAHADKNFLTEYTEEVCRKSPNLKEIFINHGGESNGIAMQRNLVKLLGDEWEDKIVIPRLHDQFVLF